MCFDIHSMYTHTPSHSIDTSGGHNLFKHLVSCFPFVFVFVFVFVLVLVVFFIHTSGGQFVQAIVFPLSFSQECPEPETKTGPFVTQTAIDLQRRTLNHIASQKSFQGIERD